MAQSLKDRAIVTHEKGFEFLGYRLWPDRLAVAEAAVERFRARLTRLY